MTSFPRAIYICQEWLRALLFCFDDSDEVLALRMNTSQMTGQLLAASSDVLSISTLRSATASANTSILSNVRMSGATWPATPTSSTVSGVPKADQSSADVDTGSTKPNNDNASSATTNDAVEPVTAAAAAVAAVDVDVDVVAGADVAGGVTGTGAGDVAGEVAGADAGDMAGVGAAGVPADVPADVAGAGVVVGAEGASKDGIEAGVDADPSGADAATALGATITTAATASPGSDGDSAADSTPSRPARRSRKKNKRRDSDKGQS